MWYFISPRNRKYQKGDKASRSTPLGSWRILSDDKKVRYNSRIVGTIKTLVFKIHGTERTDWVMHEYMLHDEKLAAKGVVQNSHVINKLFMKSGIGPRVRDDRGAPYLEEEWRSEDEDDNVLHSTRFHRRRRTFRFVVEDLLTILGNPPNFLLSNNCVFCLKPNQC
ncbi:NAC domain-containing protein 78-like [Spinacia oleracea]|uniref:NAC domain-containing protein 78-like n=1 Tax=Spinacia oleracea TaxID=3562 RepID=A0ABM3RP82_SPIOL|nr:NAC domain-containing protein 78-like [Spinacia oleracea]